MPGRERLGDCIGFVVGMAEECIFGMMYGVGLCTERVVSRFVFKCQGLKCFCAFLFGVNSKVFFILVENA